MGAAQEKATLRGHIYHLEYERSFMTYNLDTDT